MNTYDSSSTVQIKLLPLMNKKLPKYQTLATITFVLNFPMIVFP